MLQINICFLYFYLEVYVSDIWNMHNFLPNNIVHGALRCLALLSGDLDDKVVPTLVPVLFPCLLTIVSSTQVCYTLSSFFDLWLDLLLAIFVRVFYVFLYDLLSVQVYDKHLRAKALSIVYSCTSMLGVMSGVYRVFLISLVFCCPGAWSLSIVLVL